MNHKRRKKKTSTGQMETKIINSGYSNGGASRQSGVLKGWEPIRSSAKSDINAHLNILRSRAGDQAINTPIGAAAINTSNTHVIGAGLKAFPRIKYKLLGLTAEKARAWNKMVTEEFELWASSKMCDICRRNNFYDLQSILYSSYLIDGDSFALFRRKKSDNNMPYTLRLQALEASRVSNPLGQDYYGVLGPYAVEMTAPSSKNRIISGVEIDADGAVVAYWVSNKVPYDEVDIGKCAEWQRVTAFGGRTGRANILQICHDERPEQYRGVPYLAPVLETLKQVSRYTTAELTAAIIKSFFALFFVSTPTGGSIDAILPTGAGDDQRPVVDASEYGLAPGTMNALPKGVDVKSIDASRSMSTFDAFSTQLIKQIAAAIEQPYEVLIKNFTSSYSASRAALLQAWEQYRLRRIWFARDFCQPVYEVWLEEAIAIGRVQAPGFFDDPLIRKAWCNADWYGPTMAILDPIKDIKGSALRTTYGLSTHEREAAEMTGTDLEENIEQLALEQQMIKKAGLEEGSSMVLAGKVKGGEQ